MKQLVGLIGSIVVGAAIVTVGLSGDLAVAAKSGQLNGAGCIGKCGNGDNDGNGDKEDNEDKDDRRNGHAVPEPSTVILLGAALAGLGIWSWRRKSRKSCVRKNYNLEIL